MSEILEVRRRVLHATDVGAYPHVVLRLAVFVAHRADADPLRRDLAALASIPDLATPVAKVLHVLPDAVVERSVVTARAQHAQMLTDQLGVVVLHDRAKGGIHGNHATGEVGDEEPFLHALEHRMRQPCALLGALSGRDVSHR